MLVPVYIIYNLLRRTLKIDLVVKLFILFIIYLLLGQLFFDTPIRNFQTIVDTFIIPSAVYFLLSNTEIHKKIIASILISGIIIGGQGIIESIMQRNIFGPEDIRLAMGFLRTNGPFDDGIVYGAVMLLFLPLSYYSYKLNLTPKYLSVICFIVASFGSALQLSRACLFTEFTIFFILFAFKNFKSILIFTLIAILSGLIFNFFIFDKLEKTQIYKDRIANTANIEGRYERYKKLLKIFRESPLLGQGYRQISKKMNPHNSYLQNLAELGIVGFTLWMSYLLSPFILMARRYRNDAHFFEYKRSIFTLLLIIIFIPSTVSALHSPDMMLGYLIVSAVFIYYMRIPPASSDLKKI